LHALVVHHYWGRAGGSQLVCAAAAKALDFTGFKPVLVSTARIDVSRYPEWFGIDLSGYPVVDLGVRLRAFGIYLRLLVGSSMRKALRRYSAGMIFTDEYTYGRVSGIVRERRIKLIEYVHFPIEASFKKEFSRAGVYYGDDPYVLERYGRFPMNLYYKLYIKALPAFLRENPFETASLVLTSNRWTAKLAEEVYGEEPAVLNPPIPPNVSLVKDVRPFEAREDAVVMVGRFSEEKRYHWVIQEVLPRLKKACGNVKLYILGSTGTRTSKTYHAKLAEIAKTAGFKVSARLDSEADVYLIENASRKVINEVMDKAKVFLHATINEHWGIAVAEAMTRGLPAVIHKSGGAWSDIVMEGEFGLGYTNTEEVVEAVSKFLTNPGVWSAYSGKSVERARELTFEKFVERFAELVKRL
jgi:glycosyltransferase involved in cell wall biosynthesis